MSLFHSLEVYAEDILNSLKARAAQLEHSFGSVDENISHVISTLEAHIEGTTQEEEVHEEAPAEVVEEAPHEVSEEAVETK